jgi:hypothetical protein
VTRGKYKFGRVLTEQVLELSKSAEKIDEFLDNMAVVPVASTAIVVGSNPPEATDLPEDPPFSPQEVGKQVVERVTQWLTSSKVRPVRGSEMYIYMCWAFLYIYIYIYIYT